MPWATRERPERVAEMFAHNDRTNLVFLDGHVRSMPIADYPLDHTRANNLESAHQPFGYR